VRGNLHYGGGLFVVLLRLKGNRWKRGEGEPAGQWESGGRTICKVGSTNG